MNTYKVYHPSRYIRRFHCTIMYVHNVFLTIALSINQAPWMDATHDQHCDLDQQMIQVLWTFTNCVIA